MRSATEKNLTKLSDLPQTETTVYLETDWLIKKANLRAGNYREAQAKARNVGENHATGKLICKILKAAGYTVIEFKPLRKGAFKTLAGSWSDTGRRYVEKESGITTRMNDDVRDAIYAILIFR